MEHGPHSFQCGDDGQESCVWCGARRREAAAVCYETERHKDGRFYPISRLSDEKLEAAVTRMFDHQHGVANAELVRILKRLTPIERSCLLYALIPTTDFIYADDQL